MFSLKQLRNTFHAMLDQSEHHSNFKKITNQVSALNSAVLRLGEDDKQIDFQVKDLTKTTSERISRLREEYMTTQRMTEK